ncbi:MAG: DUF4344 domain-containing metallopeptidase [Planktomarina sp.]
MWRAAAALTLTATCAFGDAQKVFVEDNLTGTFYHELAHAIIARKGIAVYGQEEDAADVLAAYLIATWHTGGEAARIAQAVATAFYGDYVELEDSGQDIAWDGYHGPSLQRMHNHLCVFVGSDMDAYKGLADAFHMHEKRSTYCDYEFETAQLSWGAVIDEMTQDKGAGQLHIKGFSSHRSGVVGQWAEDLIPKVNSVITWDVPLDVRVEPCRESNAYYDGVWDIVRMCTEQTQTYARYYDLYAAKDGSGGVITNVKK